MAQIHPSAVVEKDVRLGEGVVVGPNCFIDMGTVIGDKTILEAGVVICRNVAIGRNNYLHSNCVLGGRPQILAMKPDAPMGGLIIGDNNVIRECVTIHPSMHKEGYTRIGSNNLLMIGVHIGHDCAVGDKVVMSNYAQISGHCSVETGVWLSGVVAVHQFVTIGKWCYAAGLAGINHDIPPFLIVSGHYPPKIRGVNKRGMARAGLTEQQQAAVYEAYKRLYRSKTPLLESARSIAAENGHDENVLAIVDAIIKSNQHRFGRYLETFRA